MTIGRALCMKNKVYANFDAAVADIPDGVTFMSPGFGNVGVPRNLLGALNRLGVKGLTGVSNNAGAIDERVHIGTLVEAGQIKKMICAFTAPTHPSQVTPFVHMYNDDDHEMDAELVPQGTLAERIRAAAAGIGTHVLRDLLGHKTTTMADRYVRHAGSAVTDATERMGAEMAAIMSGRPKGDVVPMGRRHG